MKLMIGVGIGLEVRLRHSTSATPGSARVNRRDENCGKLWDREDGWVASYVNPEEKAIFGRRAVKSVLFLGYVGLAIAGSDKPQRMGKRSEFLKRRRENTDHSETLQDELNLSSVPAQIL